jgi:hypothetical protein
MSGRRWLVPVLVSILLASVCGGCGKPGSTGSGASALPIDRLGGPHPRLLLTAEKQAYLRSRLDTSHKWLWERYLQDLPGKVAVSRRTVPIGDVRADGDLAADLAFAWLMTGSDSLLGIARTHLLRLTDDSQWNAPGDLVYLIGSHFLMGIALSYDWLYPALSDSERTRVAAFLGGKAEAQYQAIVKERIWWRNQYYQNHSHSNFCGLAYAAAALYGQDPRAPQWLAVCGKFFDRVFQVLPEDGGSVEGYAYAGYGGEYLHKYALLARDLLGRDYTDNRWMKNYTSYMIQGLLPKCTDKEWAMTFGDAPRRGWTSTAHHLFLLASLYRDTSAQWMGRYTVGLYPQGLGGAGWMILSWYDPEVGAADPTTFPAFKYFPVIDQVMMRSAWSDTAATLVGFYCGPSLGNTYADSALHDWGSGHRDPDAGEFQLFARGQFLAIDPLYTGFKLTADHNTMLFKNQGQLGDEIPGFASAEALRFKHHPGIVHTVSTPEYDYAVGDVRRAYHPTLGLKRFIRHVLFVKPDILLVADQVDLDDKGAVYSFPAEEIRTEGGLTHADNGYVVGPEGGAYVIFDGVPGTYSLTACYLDNRPGEGAYFFEVDGRTVHSWKSRNEELDDNLIEVSPPVELKAGSRIAFRGSPMAAECRLTKMTAFSDRVRVEREAQWLLHLDPRAEVARRGDRVEAALGGAVLDLYALRPGQNRLDWELFKIKKADVEPFTFRETKRIVILPEFEGGSALVLALMRARGSAEPALEGVKATVEGSRVRLTWKRLGKTVALDWDLEQMQPSFRF